MRAALPGTIRPTCLFTDWCGHGRQIARLARDIARELGLSDGSAARVERAARLHDVGRSKLPNVFDDTGIQPEALNRSERELLMSHTWLGYRMLQGRPDSDNLVAEVALLHHEWWNGAGYPLGLAQLDIPLAARIVALADAYGTLLEQRPIADPGQRRNALAEVEAGSGTRFDPGCVKALDALASRQAPLVTADPVTAGATVN